MRKIIVGAMVSIDGVMQSPGAPNEDPPKGFKSGGWVMPNFDQEFGKGGTDGGIAKLFNKIKKYAVSRSGDVDTSWQDSVLLRDISDVKCLKALTSSHRAAPNSCIRLPPHSLLNLGRRRCNPTFMDLLSSADLLNPCRTTC